MPISPNMRAMSPLDYGRAMGLLPHGGLGTDGMKDAQLWRDILLLVSG